MFEVKNKALLFVESSEIASTTNIREALKCSVLEKYRSSLNKFQKNFTKVTDSANVMAKFANASVNTGIGSPDETWIGRLVHFLNNTMNHCIDSSIRDSILQNCGVKFSGHEKIAEDPNRGGWNQYLPRAGSSLFKKLRTGLEHTTWRQNDFSMRHSRFRHVSNPETSQLLLLLLTEGRRKLMLLALFRAALLQRPFVMLLESLCYAQNDLSNLPARQCKFYSYGTQSNKGS